MTPKLTLASALFLGFAIVAAAPAPAAAGPLQQIAASDSAHAKVMIEAPFARASAGLAKNGAAFLTVKNMTGEADRLIGVRSDVAARTELHTHLKEDGVMKMRRVEAIEVPADGMAMLAPGGDHVMFMGLKAPLKEGETFPLTLIFEKAGEITATITVGGVGAMQGHGAGHGMGHGKKKNN